MLKEASFDNFTSLQQSKLNKSYSDKNKLNNICYATLTYRCQGSCAKVKKKELKRRLPSIFSSSNQPTSSQLNVLGLPRNTFSITTGLQPLFRAASTEDTSYTVDSRKILLTGACR